MKLENELKENNLERIWQTFSAQSALAKMCWLIGDQVHDISGNAGFIFDKHVKNYLMAANLLRMDLMKHVV